MHGKITREQTEKLLQPPEDGLFLLRASTRHPGDYTLSVSYNTGIEHYRIKYTGNRFTIDDEITFNNLDDLVKVKVYVIPSMAVPAFPVASWLCVPVSQWSQHLVSEAYSLSFLPYLVSQHKCCTSFLGVSEEVFFTVAGTARH